MPNRAFHKFPVDTGRRITRRHGATRGSDSKADAPAAGVIRL